MGAAPLVTALVLLLAVVRVGAAADDRALQWKGACSEVEAYANTLFDATRTKCGAAKGGIFAVVAEKPVFSVPAAKKAWVLIIVGAVGKIANDHPGLGCTALVMSDADTARQRRGYSLPCSTAKSLQRDISSGKLSVETAWKQIDTSLKEVGSAPTLKP
jgi:hypothetical protein